jgi:hypothetical protein
MPDRWEVQLTGPHLSRLDTVENNDTIARLRI